MHLPQGDAAIRGGFAQGDAEQRLGGAGQAGGAGGTAGLGQAEFDDQGGILGQCCLPSRPGWPGPDAILTWASGPPG